jgi:hypothetical protein
MTPTATLRNFTIGPSSFLVIAQFCEAPPAQRAVHLRPSAPQARSEATRAASRPSGATAGWTVQASNPNARAFVNLPKLTSFDVANDNGLATR